MKWSDILKLGKQKIMYCLNKLFIFFDKNLTYFELASKLYRNARNCLSSLLFSYGVEQHLKAHRAAADGAQTLQEKYEIYKENQFNYDQYLK